MEQLYNAALGTVLELLGHEDPMVRLRASIEIMSILGSTQVPMDDRNEQVEDALYDEDPGEVEAEQVDPKEVERRLAAQQAAGEGHVSQAHGGLGKRRRK